MAKGKGKGKAIRNVTGLREALAKIGVAAEEIEGAVGAALYQEGFTIMGEAQKQTPVDQGFLRRSGYVAPPIGDPAVVELGFGTDYGLAVHEREGVRHPVGNAKFLQKPYEAARKGYAKRIARRAAENWKSSTKARSLNQIFPPKPDDPGK